VFIEAEGDGGAVAELVASLRRESPPLARIDALEIAEQVPTGVAGFEICGSGDQSGSEAEGRFAQVPPDVGLCADCASEMADPRNRRFGYAFTNCTNCGPRYSIILGTPYDREQTTMAAFRMCRDCLAEYQNPLNRRFHAEPNACPACGPTLDLQGESASDPTGTARDLLRSGKILAVKGLGGFHLACDALNEEAVARLRGRKRRNGKAFALMVRSMEVAERFCVLGQAERALLADPRRPMVLAPAREGTGIAPSVAPGLRQLGLMLPYTPLHQMLFDDGLEVLVMTSGNHSEEPIVSRNEDAEAQLGSMADRFLMHNRRIQTRVDDSVLQVFEGRPYPVRRSRGFAPDPIPIAMDLPEVLACGGELKNTLCLTKGRFVIPSQHIGDLESLETMAFFRETLAHLRRLFRLSPVAVAHDLHPHYLGTRFALGEAGLPPIGVQHHHTHTASCMADNGICGRVIGVSFDGTGYGTDGNIWGGEFLVADFVDFERAGHLDYVPLAGGDAAVRQPWRSGLAYWRAAFGSGAGVPKLPGIPAAEARVVHTMIEKGIHCIPTSSCGRLFDAVASILGVRQQNTYEGQAALELEQVASGARGDYPFRFVGEWPFRVDLRTTFEALVADMSRSVSVADISSQFHATMARVVVDGCRRIRAERGLDRVCLSGGSFHNLRLLGQSVELLRGAGFQVYTHHQVPANDGGLSLGQAVIGATRVRAGLVG
jgi:hydrogenase maturation protein HypF